MLNKAFALLATLRLIREATNLRSSVANADIRTNKFGYADFYLKDTVSAISATKPAWSKKEWIKRTE